MQPSLDTPPPRRGWCSRPIVTLPAVNDHDRKNTCMETAVIFSPCYGGVFTAIAVMSIIFLFIDNAHYHANFVIQSIAVSSSSATWHVDFLVKNPKSMYTIYYGSDETAVSLGPLNAAVLNTSHERKSRSHTAFSVDFVSEGKPNDVEQLDIKLRAKHERSVYEDIPGHVDITCHNLTQNHDNVEKIRCHSSFTKLNNLYGLRSIRN